MYALQVKGIQKKYAVDPSFSLDVDHLEVNQGELFALLGPSGCGKTTLLKLIAGLIHPDAGEIYVGKRPITSIPAEKRGFGMVFQQPLLFPHMTVEDNVAFGLKMQGVTKRTRLKKARDFLERAGLAGFHQRYPQELSGGQQQRVSFVRSLVTEPELLLMDEPFSALDPELREDMQKWVKTLHVQTGTTIVFVTHDREEAFVLADRIGVMNKGKLLQVDRPESMYRRPASPEVARFMGIKNLIPGKVENRWFVTEGLKIPLDQKDLGDQKGWLMIPPYSISIEKLHSGHRLQAEVKDIRFVQGAYELTLQVADYTLETVQTSQQCLQLKPGDRVGMTWEKQDLHYISNDITRKGT